MKTSFDCEGCENAWTVYQRTLVNAFNDKPYLLYKLRELEKHGGPLTQAIIDEFADGDNILANGRMYNYFPAHDHNWTMNAFWLLAAIHTGREFTLVSPLSEKYVWRQKYPDVASALACEVSILTKVGYEVTDMNQRGFLTLRASESIIKNKWVGIRDTNCEKKRS